MNEAELIKVAKAGDAAAFSGLYDAYSRRVYDFLYFRTFHKQIAEDLCSDVFFKALKNIGKLSGNMNFGAWIFQIARNALIDHYRTAKKTADIESVLDIEDSGNLEFDADNKMLIDKVKNILKNINARERQIVVMRVWDQMEIKEIAEIMNISENNCRVIFHRALKDLRGALPNIATFLILSKIINF